MKKHNSTTRKGLRRMGRRHNTSSRAVAARFVPQLERLEDRSLMVGEVAAFTLTLTNDAGVPLADNVELSAGQTFRLLVNVQDARPDSEFDALIASIRAFDPTDTRTANDFKGFFQAFLDVNFNQNFVQSTASIPEQFTFGAPFFPSTPATPNSDLVTGAVANSSGVLNDVGNVAANFGDTPLQDGSVLNFFSAPFQIIHSPLAGQNDTNITTVQNTSIDIPVLGNDSVAGTVSFTGSPAEFSNAQRRVTMMFQGGSDPNTATNIFSLTQASQLSFTNDNLKIKGRAQIKVGSFTGLAGANVTIKNIGNDSNPTNDVLTYTPALNFTGQHTFTYELQNADDPSGPTQTVSVTVNVTDFNDPPSFNSSFNGTPNPTTINISEDAGSQTLSLSSVSAGPGESQNLRFEVTSNNPALLPVANINTSGYTSPATSGNITFQTVPNAFGQATITVQLRDAGFNGTFGDSDDAVSAIKSIVVNVADANDAPVISVPGGILNFTENGQPVTVGSGVTIADETANQISGARVTVTAGGSQLAEDLLAFSLSPGTITVSVSSNSSVTFSGLASRATYQTLLQTFTYRNTSETPSTVQRTVTFEVTDNGSPALTGTAARSVSVVGTNDAPVLGGNSAVHVVSEFGAPVVIAPDLTLTDPDNTTLSSATVQISNGFQANLDQLTFTPQAGINGSYNPATGELTLTNPVGQPRASLQSYLDLLKSVRFSSTSSSLVTRSISFAVNDGTVTATQFRAVDIAPANLTPVLGSTRTKVPLYTENSKSLKVIDNKLTLVDGDNTTLVSAQVSIVDFQPGDRLDITKKTGFISVYDANTGVLTLTTTVPRLLKDWVAVLKTVKFLSTSDNPGPTRTFLFAVNDGSPVTGVGTLLRSINIKQVNDKPTLTPATVASAVSTRQGTPVAVDSQMVVADPDNTHLTFATIKISSGYKKVQDRLSFASTANISGTFNPTNGTLTLTGTATVAEYQDALRSVSYVNISSTPTTAKRTLTYTVSDGVAKGTIKRAVTLTPLPAAQNLAGLSLAVAASGVTQWAAFGTGWAGFKNGTAVITYGAGGVPQSAELQVTNAANVVLTATIALSGNPNVLVTGNQVSGVILEVIGGSGSVNLQPLVIAEGESSFVSQTASEPSSKPASSARLSPRKTSATARTSAQLVSPEDESLPAESSSEDSELDEQSEERIHEAEEYAASVDALLAAAWGDAG